MEHKFKPGDKVRVITITGSDRLAGVRIGDVGTVDDDSGIPNVIPLPGIHWNRTLEFTEDQLELVKEEAKSVPNQSELEALVAMANAGYKAIDEIMAKYAEKVEITGALAEGRWVILTEVASYKEKRNQQRRLRIKPPVPEFKSFCVSHGTVALKDGRLQIGCQVFDASSALKAINVFYENEGCSSVKNKEVGTLTSVRTGLHHMESGKTLYWHEVEQIKEALIKAGVK